jgi:hypothetical protein
LKCRDGFQAINTTTSAIRDEGPSKRQRQVPPEHIKPPKKFFKDALHMIMASWKIFYPYFKFPLELIVFSLLS